MATITIEYDGRNSVVKKLFEVILSLGAKEVTPKKVDDTKMSKKDFFDMVDRRKKNAFKGNVVEFSSFGQLKTHLDKL